MLVRFPNSLFTRLAYIYIAYKAITRIQGFRNVDICLGLVLN